MSTSRRKTKKRKTKVKPLILLDFDSWFFFAERDGKVKSYQKEEIKVFFKGKGLKDKEEKSKFDDTLKLY